MKNRSYNIFRQRIHKSAEEKKLPLRVMFELTYRCNFQCKHCYVPQSYRNKGHEPPSSCPLPSGERIKKKGLEGEFPYNELKTEEVFSILDQLKEIGCFYLGFTGGEPFIREDIMEILRYARRCGFEVIIYTNGSLINAKIAGELQRLRPNKVDITIPAMSKDAFERISGVSGSRARVFRAIDLLHKKGVNLGFKTCLLKGNEEEIKEIQDFAASLGAPHRLDDMLSPRLDGSKEPYKYRGKMKEVRSQMSDVRNKRKFTDCNIESESSKPTVRRSLGEGGNTDKLFRCGVGVSQAAITPSGELKMCLMIDYPKHEALKSSLKDAWQKLRESVKSIKPDENYRCDKCESEPYCKWCPARGWLENRNFTSCDSESRHWAEIRKRGY